MFLDVRAALRSEPKLIPTALRCSVPCAVATSSARGTSAPKFTTLQPSARSASATMSKGIRCVSPSAPANKTVPARAGPA